MFNKVILAGNIARDIEIKYLQSGTALATTAIAVNHKYKAQDGTTKEEAMFIDLVFWGRTAEIANQYLKKGSQVLVEGRLTLEQWTAQDGSKRSKHSIAVETLQMLGSKDASNNAPAAQQATQKAAKSNSPFKRDDAAQQPQATQKAAPTQYSENIPEIDIDGNDDEIPF
ncbi:single-stranded DNA-binding protein [Aquamicrobium sp.]|uniref:single-stranded DNA-binding protein n=1 Tax=Aquamicrobium sp. TaxID=1872579 RepID=UPI002591188D|nr:single-stranded DNA-binding protein [Aquamicrobium sp.]MCK9553634.1 single-stranded DNA-binding protein [Aquamicrobium sp.]